MEKFTKGEWFSKDGDGFSKEVIITTDDREDCFIIPICEMDMFFDGDVGVEQAANAALIAAAPEMYGDIKLDIDWLKRLRSLFVLGSDGFRSCSLRIESKEKLLSKARGE